MTLRNRLDRLENMTGAGLPELVRVDREGWESMTPGELEAHRAQVRRVAMNPRGVLIILQDEGDPDPLAELLGPDDPAVTRHRGPGVTIARSYGLTR